ncbi:MAG: chemotaxis response regulator protein-glutamate methylesterase [Bryobacteraceae bacterium]|nr:chemotaxis response regulator protein-glutamate methylesterase [Bryobacteraceae bacterium]
MTIRRKIRVLVVDDSAIVRKILTESLAAEPDLEVVGSAPDPYVARDKILALQPDVLTLDIEMPRMDGLTFLKKLMHHHAMPVIVISSIGQASCQAAIEAMRLGAVEVLAKPSGPYSVGELRASLAMKIRAASASRVRREALAAQQVHKTESPLAGTAAGAFHPYTVIAIGASTGGTEAIEAILTALPEQMPGIVVTQHIPAGFSRAFAERLNRNCRIEVKEAENGDFLRPGRALVAPGDFHMLLRRTDSGYRVSVRGGPRICYQRPSVNVLYASVAEAAGARAVGVILTGMGSDGAEGMLRMKQVGAFNIAQDESSCVVFGMPKEAIRAGGVDQVAPLNRIPSALLAAVHSAARNPVEAA